MAIFVALHWVHLNFILPKKINPTFDQIFRLNSKAMTYATAYSFIAFRSCLTEAASRASLYARTQGYLQGDQVARLAFHRSKKWFCEHMSKDQKWHVGLHLFLIRGAIGFFLLSAICGTILVFE
jgi:hypothetical protein